MRTVKSCGVLVFRAEPEPAFLLMRHARRFDLPKGHLKNHESELAGALRELEEETSISPAQIEVDPDFRFSTSYRTPYKRFGGETVEKTLVVFLARLKETVEIKLTEHRGFQWVVWNPPHSIQPETIDPLLAEVARFLAK